MLCVCSFHIIRYRSASNAEKKTHGVKSEIDPIPVMLKQDNDELLSNLACTNCLILVSTLVKWLPICLYSALIRSYSTIISVNSESDCIE